ncbi:MaoC/PaaZ C-terminal domain-containing protein [Saccharopolyspora sp. CA-218241]|uniref:MaoC/PaaZ C-terminal domain-containing protein n=1 Tax=Saccharopolyspora sp. CA-218241 TaxID=3240027 RepID=UPI003D969744
MPIDPTAALAAEPTSREVRWTSRDVLLYHLSLGAGRHAATGPELGYTYERDLRVLPTFAMVAGQGPSAGDGPAPGLSLPGIDVDLHRLLHAGQELAVHRPIPPAGTAVVTSRVAELWDKGKAALIVQEQRATADGDPLWTTTTRIWARGEGGFGGDPGPASPQPAPDRPADLVLDTPTTADQALLYRLNGDLNPLHVDPEFAASAGFDRPILHGLASYGIVAKAVVDGALDGDVTRLAGLSVRFARPVFPGGTIRTSLWWQHPGLALVATCPEQDEAPVLTHATATIRR